MPVSLDPVPDGGACFFCFFFDVSEPLVPAWSSPVELPLPIEPDELPPVPMLPWSLPVVDEPEEPVPPVEDDPVELPFDFSSLEEEPLPPIDEDEPEEPPLIDDPLSPEEPDVPSLLPCAAATPTPSAARAPAKNN